MSMEISKNYIGVDNLKTVVTPNLEEKQKQMYRDNKIQCYSEKNTP